MVTVVEVDDRNLQVENSRKNSWVALFPRSDARRTIIVGIRR